MGLLQWLKGAAGNQQITDVSEDNPMPFWLKLAAIILPIDKQAIFRAQQFLTTTNLAAGATYTSPTIDMIQSRRLTGRSRMDTASQVDIQMSDDGTTWDTKFTQTAAANVTVWYNEEILTRYGRVLIKNTDGVVATTFVRGSGYSSVE